MHHPDFDVSVPVTGESDLRMNEHREGGASPGISTAANTPGHGTLHEPATTSTGNRHTHHHGAGIAALGHVLQPAAATGAGGGPFFSATPPPGSAVLIPQAPPSSVVVPTSVSTFSSTPAAANAKVNVFIKNIPNHCNTDHVAQIFARFGPIASARVMTSRALPVPPNSNFGFVLYHSADSAAAAVTDGRNIVLDGVVLDVEFARSRPVDPPNGGGGGGAVVGGMISEVRPVPHVLPPSSSSQRRQQQRHHHAAPGYDAAAPHGGMAPRPSPFVTLSNPVSAAGNPTGVPSSHTATGAPPPPGTIVAAAPWQYPTFVPGGPPPGFVSYQPPPPPPQHLAVMHHHHHPGGGSHAHMVMQQPPLGGDGGPSYSGPMLVPTSVPGVAYASLPPGAALHHPGQQPMTQPGFYYVVPQAPDPNVLHHHPSMASHQLAAAPFGAQLAWASFPPPPGGAVPSTSSQSLGAPATLQHYHTLPPQPPPPSPPYGP